MRHDIGTGRPIAARAGRLLALLALAPAGGALAAPETVDVIVRCARPCAAVESRIEAMGGRVTRRYENADGLAATIPAGALGSLRAEAGVDAVEGDALVELPRARGDAPTPVPFDVDAARVIGAQALAEPGAAPADHASYLGAFTGAAEVWPETGLGDGAIVAVVDTGTYADHVCLRGRVIAGPDLSTDVGTPFEGSTRVGNSYHGTFVAGEVASNCAIEIDAGSGFDANLPPEAKIPVAPGIYRVPLLGIAPQASIYAVKIFSHTGASVPESTILAALDHVIGLKRSGALDVDAMNLSFGSVTLFDGRSLEEELVDEATRAGIVVAVSAGNDGPSPGTLSRPATAFSALTVGAAADPVHTRVFLDEFYGFVGAGAVLYPTDELRVMEFSSRGPTADGRPGPDLVATGLFNFGLFPSPPGPAFAWSSGTSFAAPQAAGAAALLRAWAKRHAPWLDAARIRRALIDGAEPIGDDWSVQAQGAGMLDLPIALALLQRDGAARRAAGPRSVRGGPPATTPPGRGPLEPSVRLPRGGSFHERVSIERGRSVDWVLEIDDATESVVIEIEPVGGAIPPGPSGALGFPESFELFVKSAKRGGVEPDFVDGANVTGAARVEIRAGAAILQGGIAGNLVSAPPAVLEPGLMKVSLESDWTNNTRWLSADVTLTRIGRGSRPLRRPTAWVGDAETRSFPVEIPPGTESARFDLAWSRDWTRFPTDDLDLILVSPSGREDVSAATYDAPERAVIANPEPGTWTAIVDGFTVARGPAPFVLQVTLEAQPPGAAGARGR